jgi:hypothetical protein
MTRSKYDAIHTLKQNGWTDAELDAIGLSLCDEGEVTIPERPWSIPKRDRILVDIIEDGSAKTFVYEDLEAGNSKINNWRRNLLKTFRILQRDD